MTFDLKLDETSKGVLFRRLAMMSLKIRENVEAEVDKSSKAIQTAAKSRAPRDNCCGRSSDQIPAFHKLYHVLYQY